MKVIVHNTIRLAEIVEIPDGVDIESLPHDRTRWPHFGASVTEQSIEFIEPETVRLYGGEDLRSASSNERACRRDIGYWTELVRNTKDSPWNSKP